MFYAPHKLYRCVYTIERDENGFPMSKKDCSWTFITMCRCDDADTQEIIDSKGRAFRATFHIVCPKCDIKAGDYVNVAEKECQGEVRKVKHTNYLQYTELWI